MSQWIGIAVLVVAGLWLLGWIYSYIKGLLPTSVTNVVDKVSAYADQTAAAGALLSIALAAKKRKDSQTVADCGAIWQRVLLWDDAPAAPVITVSPTIEAPAATVAVLSAEVAGLKTALADAVALLKSQAEAKA
jgi:hypothetical protein